jgi:hypothetical protein
MWRFLILCVLCVLCGKSFCISDHGDVAITRDHDDYPFAFLSALCGKGLLLLIRANPQ